MNSTNTLQQDLTIAEHLFSRGNVSEAESQLKRVLSYAPSNSAANELMAYIEGRRNNTDAALRFLKKATCGSKASPEAWYYLGRLYKNKKQYAEATSALEESLAIAGDFFEGLHDLGVVLALAGNHAAALAMFDRAIKIRPESSEVLYNKAKLLLDLRRFSEAEVGYQSALALDPDLPYVAGDYLFAKMNTCSWRGIQDTFDAIAAGIESGRKVASPFTLLAMPSSPALQQKCAEMYSRDKFPPHVPNAPVSRRATRDRIRLGYFSADFHDHATTHLMAQLIELHDRSSFEVFGFSFGPPSDDPMRRRVAAAFDTFMDVSSHSDEEVARISRNLEIDIAVDLKGFTKDSRTAIFSYRAAPVQVSYLGYPGTMGVEYIDYLIADPVVVPKEHMEFYAEKIAYLPNSYQVNDSSKAIANGDLCRRDHGLPEKGFVFCCFNANFKITPDVFSVWMRLLQRVPGSVLWLLGGDQTTARNLRSEAERQGVEPARLIFAGRIELSQHLARHRLADLFLDTFYYNAHTTASDALWAGLPVLTCMGEAFAARVAASLLNAIGMADLVTGSHHEYEALAYQLAVDSHRLSLLTQRLRNNREASPLFNTALFTDHIEEVYMKMWDRYLSGLEPDHIGVNEDMGLA